MGETYGAEELAGIFRILSEKGCHNWNLVSPTPWLPLIRESLEIVRSSGVSLPIVYNTSGFERIETLAEYADLANIFLADLRYASETSAREGSDVSGYVEIARAALKEMWRRAGPLVMGGNGTAVSGTICRLLILPGRAEETVENLKWLSETIGTDITLSVMSQYIPAYKAASREPWRRTISKAEYEMVRDAVDTLGFCNGWLQHLGGSTPRELIGFKMR